MPLRSIRDNYISLLKKAILNELYPDDELIILELQEQAKKFGHRKPDNFFFIISKHGCLINWNI